MKLLINEKTRVIALASIDHALLFRTSENDKVQIELISKESFNHNHFKQLSPRHAKIHGFLGLIQVQDGIFLCTITGKSEVASPLPKETVNKIHSVEFHCLNKKTWDFLDIDSSGYPSIQNESSQIDGTSSVPGQINTSQEHYEQHPCYELRKLLSNGSFYYSSNFDLTTDLQRRGVGSNSLSFDKFDQEYMWNSFMMDEIISFRNKLGSAEKQILDENGFLTTLIRGFAESFQTHIKSLKTRITVVSRQSWKRAGTRFNARGIDDDGNVANFVETEFILYCSKVVYSFTEIRGSVPVFWEQDTLLINPKVSVTRSLEATQPVFEKHFSNLFLKYGRVHVVNLLSTKTNELELTKRYRSHLKRLHDKTSDILLTEFDFHHEAGKNFEMADKILPLVRDSLQDFNYYAYDLTNGEVLSEQSGTFRTNCLDCLDRTNVIQQVISAAMLNIFFQDNNIPTSYEMDLLAKHRTLWADHGDAISQIYTGTNALKSSFSRNGKMGFAGLLSDATKSVSRMYINNFVDKNKQVTIDMLLGKLEGQAPVQIYDPVSDYVVEELNKQSHRFTTHGNITIFTGTYNLAGVSRVGDLTEWLFPLENNGSAFAPDVIILGFQEVVELNAGNILNSDKSQSVYWQKLVLDQLNSTSAHDYVMLRAEQMASLMLLFFVKKDEMKYVKKVEGATKKTGLGGMTANKGGVAIRFDYGETSFCVVNCHLAAGMTNVDERSNDYNTIYNGTTFTRGKKIKDHDAIIWLGDLNFRIALDNETVRARVDQREYHTLMQHDQLKAEMNSKGGAFKQFYEMAIDFKPTYKYDKGTGVYDTSEKQRTPSWTDRILYNGKKLNQLNYNSVDSVMFSDHKPVYGTFEATVEFVDHQQKNAMKIDLYHKFKASHQQETVSLIDWDDASSSPATSVSRSSTPSTGDAPPLLPSRRATTEFAAPVPQQLPLPPAARRKLPPAPAASDAPLLPMRPASSSNTTNTTSSKPVAGPPLPPQPRKAPTQTPPIGFSSVPLMPTRSASATPVSSPPPPTPLPRLHKVSPPAASPLSKHLENLQPQPQKIVPLVPKKPSALSKFTAESALNSQSPSPAPSSYASSLSEWKPLQPK